MPGVPSYRGCDACRRQKKKCDQATPACSRCTRLQIPCVGCGQQRYKFKHQSVVVNRSNRAHNKAAPWRQSESPPFVLGNQTTARSGAFVSLLEVTDPGYDLSCYGGWFKDLPRRLGSNEALDAAVDAMAGFYPYLRKRELSRESVVKYVNALQALRTCLNDPAKATKPETLCAVYVILICQGWTGIDSHQKVSHGEGLAHLLDATASRGRLDTFESLMHDTLCVPVILESIYNPRIRSSPWFLKLKAQAYGPLPPLNDDRRGVLSLELINLVKIPDLVHDPVKHVEDITYSYQRMRIEIPVLKRALEQVDGPVYSDELKDLPSSSLARIHVQHLVSYCLLLSTALIFNGFLRALGADDGYMVEEATVMANEVVALGESAARYRPLGASFVPLFSIPAWAATDDQEIQKKVVKILETYRHDFTPPTARSWYIIASWLKGQMDLVRHGFPPSPTEDHHCGKWGTVDLDERGDAVIDGVSRGWFDV